MTALDTTLARKMHRTLEPYHGFVYFAPEPAAAYAAVGVTDTRMGYFASRSAALGAVSAEVVIATFFNFSPDLVRRAIPAAWDLATPAQLLAARLEGVDQALRNILGPDVLEGPEVAEAAELARRASSACTLEGRPLFAAHAALPWPDPPHLVLWQAQTLLREWRGDGHIACLVEQGISGLEALVLHETTGEVPGPVPAGQSSPHRRGVGRRPAGACRSGAGSTPTARPPRRVGRSASSSRPAPTSWPWRPWTTWAAEDCDRLRQLVRPLSRRIVESGTFGFRPARPEERS